MKFKLFIVSFLVILFSCKKENRCDCVKPTGNNIIQLREIKDFNCIAVEDKINIHLTQGVNYEVKVEAGANLQNLIKTEIDGETLKVYNRNRCNWVRGYKHTINVYITAPFFKHIKNAGLGSIENIGVLTQDSIFLRNENSGDIKLSLNTNKTVCSSHGNGDTYLTGVTNNLQSDYTGTNFLFAKSLIVNGYSY
jgi:hypothetical protein